MNNQRANQKMLRVFRSQPLVIGFCCLLIFFPPLTSPLQIENTENTTSRKIAPPKNISGPLLSSSLGFLRKLPTNLTEEPERSTYLPKSWYALPNGGLDPYHVEDIAIYQDKVYAAGGFDKTGDSTLTGLGNIAVYYPKAGVWEPMPSGGLTNNGQTSFIEALAISGDDLYVGGEFSQTGDGAIKELGNIARFDISTGKWHPLPKKGLNGRVYSLEVSGNDLFVGGSFDSTGDNLLTDLGNIARYDTSTQTWHALPRKGLNGPAYAMQASGDDLYVGGNFTELGDKVLLKLGYIVRYNKVTKSWHKLPNDGFNWIVEDMTMRGTDLYIGGAFWRTYDFAIQNMNKIARFSTSDGKFYALPNMGIDPNGYVYALEISGNDLYVGGEFTQTGDGSIKDLGNIARFYTPGKTWHQLPNNGLGVAGENNKVLALAGSESDLYVGGRFPSTADKKKQEFGNIARLELDAPQFNRYLPVMLK